MTKVDDAVRYIEAVTGHTYGPCLRWRASTVTGHRWYVADTHISKLGDGVLTSGGTGGDTPEEAVLAYLEWMKEGVLVTDPHSDKHRRYWQWDGVRFDQVPEPK